jgi:hypothetical protein
VAFVIGAVVGVVAGWFLARATATAPARETAQAGGEPVAPRSLGGAITDFLKIAGLLVVVGIVILVLATDIAHHHS